MIQSVDFLALSLSLRKSDEALADQGAAILVIIGCDEVFGDQGSAI